VERRKGSTRNEQTPFWLSRQFSRAESNKAPGKAAWSAAHLLLLLLLGLLERVYPKSGLHKNPRARLRLEALLSIL